MRRVMVSLVGAALAVGLVSGVAFAQHNEPSKAGQQKGEFITAYQECSSPSATTSNGFPACSPAVRSDPSCGFGSKGKGKYLALSLPKGPDGIAGTSDDGDVKFQAGLIGLDSGCTGKTLVFATTVVATTDDCSGSSCTVITLTDFVLAPCTVDSVGKCTVAPTTVNTQLPGTILPGKHLGIAVKGVDMLDGSAVAFQGGILVP